MSPQDTLQQTAPGAEPPLGVKAALHMAWGLTLQISHEAQQQNLGEMFEEQFKEIWKTHADDKYARQYLEHLSAMLSASLRSMAFERDAYVRYLEYQRLKGEAGLKAAEGWSN